MGWALGFGLRFGGPVLVIPILAFEEIRFCNITINFYLSKKEKKRKEIMFCVGPHPIVILIGAHIFNIRRNNSPLPLISMLHT